MDDLDEDDLNEDEAILKLLAEHGVARARIEFSGGGDSGEINEITTEGLAKPELVEAPPTWEWVLKEHCGSMVWDTETRVSKERTFYSIKDLIEVYAYNVIERTGEDWCNNEGGGGVLIIEPGTGKIDLDMYVNVMSQHDVSHDFSITVPWAAPVTTEVTEDANG